ncbi:hybrid sensor histidine kinase/response regulator [Burkholderia stagnalis]|uniref:hybrid sensor histidine kinase/response regulator n=1 Tax=Burkholderia stagnalis TaxID=1503054 RepID=UPI0009C0CC60|nr:hybrid sensor histidine kinase/response regulator [Burkholderia stagnalis]
MGSKRTVPGLKAATPLRGDATSLRLGSKRRVNILGRLHRYQRLLMYGGAAVISAMVALALAVQIDSTVARYIGYESDVLSNGVTLLTGDVRMEEAALRNAVVNFELTSMLSLAAAPSLVDRFERNGRRLVLQHLPPYSQWIVGIQGKPLERSALAHDIGVAERIGQASVANSMARGSSVMHAYYMDGAKQLMTIVPAPLPGTSVIGTIAFDRQLFDTMSIGFENLAGSDSEGIRSMQWALPFVNPLTGTRTVRIGAAAVVAGARTSLVIFEYTPEQIMEPLRGAFFGGTFILVARDGQLIGEVGHHASDDTLVERALLLHAAPGSRSEKSGRYGNGVILFASEIESTGWTLLYVLSARQVLAAFGWQIGGALLVAGLLIVIVWVSVALFERRVFMPAFEYSQRVFDSEHLSRTLVETAPVGLAIVSLESGKPLLSSAMMADLVETTSERASMLFRIAIDKYSAAARRPDFNGMTDIVRDEMEWLDSTGRPTHLAMGLATAKYKGENVLVLTLSDISANKALEKTLLDAKLAADSANAAKTTFLATMSHEIRTPLSAIVGHLELLEDSPMTEKQRDRLVTIRNASNGLLVTINDVLDFSKIEANQLALDVVEFRISDVVEHALEMFAPVARAKDVALFNDFGCSIEQLTLGDPARVAQILNNLLGNAIKFTADGRVTLRTRIDVARQDGEAVLRMTVEDTGIGMTQEQRAALFQPFAQADASIGRRFGGTGLGLALCRQLASAMKGAIEVESKPGVGSRFTVSLPLGLPVVDRTADVRFAHETILFVSARSEWRDFVVPQLRAWNLDVRAHERPADVTDAELASARAVIVYGDTGWRPDEENRLAEAASRMVYCVSGGPSSPLVIGQLIDLSCYALSGLADALMHALEGKIPGRASPETRIAAGNSAPVPARSLRVLIVEDNVVNRELLSEQLIQLGCEVVAVADGLAALDRLRAEQWDVVFTDVNMPVMNGYEFTRLARADLAQMPIVAVTASATVDEIARCMASGMSKVLTKPLSLAQLRGTLSSVSKGGTLSALSQAETHPLLDSHSIPSHLRELFKRSLKDLMKDMRQASAEANADRMSGLLHSLKGACGVLGLHELARQCRALEAHIATDGIADVGGLLSGFEASLSAALD